MKFRAFIAVDIGPMQKLVDLSEALRASGADIKLVEPENIHITLKFLGDTDEELIDPITDGITDSIQGVKPFEVRFEGMGAFPKLDYMRVVWVGLEGTEPLVQISRKLDSALAPLGFKKDKKGFNPHITIARVRSPRGKSELRNIIDSHSTNIFGSINVSSITLKKSVLSSAGPTYTDIKEIGLSD
jgi:2'-5' RNA ligase